MAYMGYCRLCHHLKADVKETWLVESFIEHAHKCHSGNYDVYIWRISADDYKAFLEAKDNPKFWEAWKIIKAVTKVEARLKAIG